MSTVAYNKSLLTIDHYVEQHLRHCVVHEEYKYKKTLLKDVWLAVLCKTTEIRHWDCSVQENEHNTSNPSSHLYVCDLFLQAMLWHNWYNTVHKENMWRWDYLYMP